MIYDATISCSVTVYFDATRTLNEDESASSPSVEQNVKMFNDTLSIV